MEQIGQRAAVYISVDVILKAVPEGEGAAGARAVALFAVGGQAGHRRDGVALSRAQNFAGRVLGGGTQQALSAGFAHRAFNQAALAQRVHDGLKVFTRDILPHDDVVQRHIAVRALSRQIEHDPQRIAAL